MTHIQPWITNYLKAHIGKESIRDPNWSMDTQRLVQIVEHKKHPKHHPEHTGITLVVSDTQVHIKCKIIADLFGEYSETAFQNNTIINLNCINPQISHDYRSVYFVVLDCSFISAIPLSTVGKDKERNDINNVNEIHRLLRKYRTCMSNTFLTNPNKLQQVSDSNALPGCANIADQSFFAFENLRNSLRATPADNNKEKAIQLQDGEYENICDFCETEAEEEEDSEQMQQDQGDDDDDDVEMVQDEVGNKELDEEKGTAIDDERNRFTKNKCDWIYSLYPDFTDIPIHMKTAVIDMVRPQGTHTPTLSMITRKRKNTTIDDGIPSKRQRIMTQNAEEKGNEKNKDILPCDLAVKQSETERELGKPTYSLTERYEMNHNDNRSNVNVATEVEALNDNVLSELSVGKHAGDIMDNVEEVDDELEELLYSDDDIGEEDATEDFMNEPVDRDYLGLISRNDLDRIHRYFIEVGKILNANGNCHPNNPFRVTS